MNPFLRILQKEGNYSVQRLKQVYRVLAKQTHPDLNQGKASFVDLKKAYEEALEVLEQEKSKAIFVSPRERRKILLEKLIVYGRIFYAPKCDDLILEIIEIAESYGSETGRLFDDYYETVYPKFGNYTGDLEIRRLHTVLMTCIREMAAFFKTGEDKHRRIFLSYERDFAYTEPKNKEKYGILMRFYNWLKEELEKGLP